LLVLRYDHRRDAANHPPVPVSEPVAGFAVLKRRVAVGAQGVQLVRVHGGDVIGIPFVERKGEFDEGFQLTKRGYFPGFDCHEFISLCLKIIVLIILRSLLLLTNKGHFRCAARDDQEPFLLF